MSFPLKWQDKVKIKNIKNKWNITLFIFLNHPQKWTSAFLLPSKTRPHESINWYHAQHWYQKHIFSYIHSIYQNLHFVNMSSSIYMLKEFGVDNWLLLMLWGAVFSQCSVLCCDYCKHLWRPYLATSCCWTKEHTHFFDLGNYILQNHAFSSAWV